MPLIIELTGALLSIWRLLRQPFSYSTKGQFNGASGF